MNDHKSLVGEEQSAPQVGDRQTLCARSSRASLAHVYVGVSIDHLDLHLHTTVTLDANLKCS